jgi:hypothetical protein
MNIIFVKEWVQEVMRRRKMKKLLELKPKVFSDPDYHGVDLTKIPGYIE